jgi:hypothetical protein
MAFWIHLINGILLTIGIFYLGRYLWTNNSGMNDLDKGKAYLLVSIAVGVHGFIHLMTNSTLINP